MASAWTRPTAPCWRERGSPARWGSYHPAHPALRHSDENERASQTLWAQQVTAHQLLPPSWEASAAPVGSIREHRVSTVLDKNILYTI